jgi:hypothetical protein
VAEENIEVEGSNDELELGEVKISVCAMNGSLTQPLMAFA